MSAQCSREHRLDGGTLRCVLDSDHVGYHVDEDGLPFGPWVERDRAAEVEAAEDRAEQAAFDVMRERS